MSVSRTDSAGAESPRLPSRKVRDLVGVFEGAAGVLLILCLVSYHPDDPSLFFKPETDAGARNLIGPVGANCADLLFRLVGVPVLLLPALLLIGAVRRVWGGAPAVAGRALGLGLLWLVLPPLVQLLLIHVTWRGVVIDAGGFFGRLAADQLTARLGFAGALVLLACGLTAGLALAVQSSLGELMSAFGAILRGRLERGRLALLRRRERREKDRARQRVVAKHLERARERRGGEPVEQVSARVLAMRADLPAPVRVRVVRRGGAMAEAAPEEPPWSGMFDDSPPIGAPAEQAPAAAIGPPGELPPPRLEVRPPARASVVIAEQRSLPMSKPRPQALPPLNLLNLEKARPSIDENELVRLGDAICQRCSEFGVAGTIQGITPGPVITVFEFQPAPGVKVSRILNLQDDLALALKAEAIRIDRIPGRSTLGIEVPNNERSTIRLGSLLADEAFRKAPSPLTLALGQTLHGQNYYVDLASMPHLLVAGATGAGKSVGLQSMITSILYKATRDQVQFIFIDPKRIELGVYADIPHLKAEVVVEPKKAANALRWAVAEMDRRYRLLAEVHVRSIDFYNRAIQDPEVQRRLALRDEDAESHDYTPGLKPLPYYVIVIDELADLMMVSTSDVEMYIARLAQMARAVGIHLIVATQRPSVDVLTGMIKANFPCRLAYAVAARHDSRTILDEIGAEKLLGRGDALFMPPGSSRIFRLHGAYISEQETAGLVRWMKKQGPPAFDPEVLRAGEDINRDGGESGLVDDELYDEAARLVVAEGKASASFLQRRMRIGFSRAARLIDLMEQDGLLGPSQGSKPREILVKPDYFSELDRQRPA